MKYKVCDHCGAHLDNGETCDCRKEEDNNNAEISQKHECNKSRPYRHGGKKC